MTVISDGEPALRNLVKAATGEDVTHILDWWHLSIRVRHIEQIVQGMEASETPVHRTHTVRTTGAMLRGGTMRSGFGSFGSFGLEARLPVPRE